MNANIDITGLVLTTPRLVLRPWRETDLEDLYAYASVDGVGQMAGWSPHRDREESRRILGQFMEGRHTFALEFGGRVIGSLGLEAYNEAFYPELAEKAGREIGYVLAKDCWGQGLMPEAVRAVMAYCFGTLGLDFLIVGHFVQNRQSRRVIEKCGFRYNKALPYETRFGTTETSMEYILERSEYHADT